MSARKLSEAVEEKSTDKKTLERIIRPELNIEKLSLWKPTNSRSKPKERTFERKIHLPSGDEVTARITVSFTGKGALTTEDQKVYYALVKLWEEKGGSITFTPFSRRRLAQVLGLSWNDGVGEKLKGALDRLRITPFIWEYSYLDKESGDMTTVHPDPFTILSELKSVERRKDGHTTIEGGYFRFSDIILKNLCARHTKPVLFDVVLSFRSEVAQLLYSHFDLVLFGKTRYERATKGLFEDLGLEGKAYNNLSDRTRTLKRALNELHGARLTSGIITRAELEPTKSGDDYKLVVQRGRAERAIQPQREKPSLLPPSSPDKGASDAETLVRHFHQLFHNAGVNISPQSKELDQARALLAQYGLERARYVIEFAHREAPKTNFSIRTFGGILQYVSQALAELDRKESLKDKSKTCPYCERWNGMRYRGKRGMNQCTHNSEYEAQFDVFN